MLLALNVKLSAKSYLRALVTPNCKKLKILEISLHWSIKAIVVKKKHKKYNIMLGNLNC